MWRSWHPRYVCSSRPCGIRSSMRSAASGTRRKCREWPLLHAPNSWPRRREESRTYSIIVETTYEHTRFTSTDRHNHCSRRFSVRGERAPARASRYRRPHRPRQRNGGGSSRCMHERMRPQPDLRARARHLEASRSRRRGRALRSPGAAVVPQGAPCAPYNTQCRCRGQYASLLCILLRGGLRRRRVPLPVGSSFKEGAAS